MDKMSPGFVELIFYVIKSIKALLTNKHNKYLSLYYYIIHLEESGKKQIGFSQSEMEMWAGMEAWEKE